MPKPNYIAMPKRSGGEGRDGEDEGMAYKQSIKKSCANCGGVASVEVFNSKNASHGYYCARCGERRVKEIEKVEKDLAKK